MFGQSAECPGGCPKLWDDCPKAMDGWPKAADVDFDRKLLTGRFGAVV